MAFYNVLPLMKNAVNTNISSCERMQIIFASARLAGMPVSVSYGLQTIFSFGAVILVAWAWRQKNSR